MNLQLVHETPRARHSKVDLVARAETQVREQISRIRTQIDACIQQATSIAQKDGRTYARILEVDCWLVTIENSPVPGGSSQPSINSPAVAEFCSELRQAGYEPVLEAVPRNDSGQGRSWTDYYIAIAIN